MDDPVDLLGHIAAQQAEIDRLEGQVAALREGLNEHTLSDCLACKHRDLLADTEAAAKAHDQRIVKQWLLEHLPERYTYQYEADEAFAALCKDAFAAMPGNIRREQLAGARRLYDDSLAHYDADNSEHASLHRHMHGVLADMEREAGQ